MTREALLELRRKKKRKKAAVRIGLAIAAAVLVLCLIVTAVLRLRSDAGSGEANSVDTVDTKKMTNVNLGETGWNLDDAGWWYKTADGQLFVNGWKTLDGQRYYFLDDGHIATGWVTTKDGTDCYFDAGGRYDQEQIPDMVALTFDDGPSNYTNNILDTLTSYNAKATFMIVGQQLDYFSDELKREYALGMEIGSHTYDHTDLTSLTSEEIQAELSKNDEVIRALVAYTPAVLRPPGGAVDENVRGSVDRPMILWDVDTRDWESQDADSVAQIVLDNVKPGSVILMHDLYESTAEAVATIVPELQARGYKMVTVSELCEAYGYTMEAGKVYNQFYPE